MRIPLASYPMIKSHRFWMIVSAVAVCVPLVIATQLTPDPTGVGTHQQLGMPPCGVLATWNLRCPTCGMTTAYAHAVRGQIGSALAASVAGTMLALLSPVVAAWLVMSAIAGRWYCRPSSGLVLGAAAVFALVTLCDWLVRLGPSLGIPK